MLATMGLFSMLGKTTLGPLVIPVVSSSSSVSLEDNAKVEAADKVKRQNVNIGKLNS